MIQLDLPGDIEKKLRDQAARTGQQIETVIIKALREKVEEPLSVDSILAPFREAYLLSGTSDEDLEQAIEDARNDVWQAKQNG